MQVVAPTASTEGQRRALLWLPGLAWVATVILQLAAILLSLSDPSPDDPGAPDAIFVPLFLAMVGSLATVGALLALRRSTNPIGWMLLAGAGLMAVSFFGSGYAQFSYGTGRNLPGAAFMGWLPIVAFAPALVVTGLVILVFPSGRLQSWGRQILAVVLVGLILSDISGAVQPGPLQTTLPLANPFGINAAAPVLPGMEALGNALLVIGFLLATWSLAVRFRAARGEERQQSKWFAYVAVVLAASLAVATVKAGPISDVGWPVSFLAFTALPIAIAIAVLKYRLYDIDTLVNRTLVYLPLVGILGGLYAAFVALFQRLFLTFTGSQSDAAVVMTTLVVAGTFTPIRKNLEAAVDRRFRSPPHALHAVPGLGSGGEGSQAPIDLAAILDDPRLTARMEAIARSVAAGPAVTAVDPDPDPTQPD